MILTDNIQKIDISLLRVGMHICDLNMEWMAHPFLRNELDVRTPEQIKAIIESGIKTVYIDSKKGRPANVPCAKEIAKTEEMELHKAVIQPLASPRSRVPLEQELGEARLIFQSATGMVMTLMEDLRLGRPMHLLSAQTVVNRIVTSILRNSNAMPSLCRLRSVDNYTFEHSVSVAVFLINLARTMNPDADIAELQDIGLGGLIHDLGKAIVDQDVLNKPDKLTDEEWRHMQGHVALGGSAAREIESISATAMDVLWEHHERFDGTGYPGKLQGNNISMAGRMASLCDVYDAITTDRVYHKGMNAADGIRRIFGWSKYHFDPEITKSFVRSVGVYPIGTLVRLESGYLAFVVESRTESLLTPRVQAVYDYKHGKQIPAFAIDTAETGDCILSYEDPSEWDIQPELKLALP